MVLVPLEIDDCGGPGARGGDDLLREGRECRWLMDVLEVKGRKERSGDVVSAKMPIVVIGWKSTQAGSVWVTAACNGVDFV